jgi:hypothetical protein
VDAIVGNPPFLGGSKKRGELGDETFERLAKVFKDRVPAGADLVCYWFDKGRKHIAEKNAMFAGFVATNSIRGGANRVVLDNITANQHIHNAWSDEEWVNDGAAVRVSIVNFSNDPLKTPFEWAFPDGTPWKPPLRLDSQPVMRVNADLTGVLADSSAAMPALNFDLTHAKPLRENLNVCFMGASKKAPFDIDGAVARAWLAQPNSHGQSNASVLRPLYNGADIVRRWGDRWIVDFGTDMDEPAAQLFSAPFQYVYENVLPVRKQKSQSTYLATWWLHARARGVLREKTSDLARYIATPAVSKHRVFVWLSSSILADQATLATARDDDTSFGILHSRMHELWSLRMGTSLEDRPRYTPTTCFETFPFPEGLTPNLPPAQYANPQAGAIAAAAQHLDTLRNRWLNPPEWVDVVPEVVPLGMAASPYPDRIVPKPEYEKEIKKRTLTNLYNERPAWLAAAHETLDAAVAQAYGWQDYTPVMADNEILRRLLALNLARAAAQG